MTGVGARVAPSRTPVGAAQSRLSAVSAAFGPLARKTINLSALTAAGQFSFVLALPILSRLYTPADFGLFTVYLSLVNICGPIAGLKFESGLYAARTRRDARLTLALSLITMASVATMGFFALPAIASRLPGLDPASAGIAARMTAVGILFSGTWSLSSAWAIRRDAMPALGVARFAQPTAMTILQVAAGLLFPSGVALVVAHLMSHVGYTTYLFSRTLGRRDLVALRPRFWPALRRHARANARFPMFLAPAQVATLMVSNLPPVLLSAIYGAAIAGHCGVAYRIVAAPLTVVSLPLGAVVVGAASRAARFADIRPLALKAFAAALVVVAVPLLALAVLAPSLAGAALGPAWAVTGQIIAPFAILGAAQAMAAPFSELTSVYRMQGLRFFTEVGTAVLVVASIGAGAAAAWGPLPTIWLMSIGGAAGILGGLTLTWVRLSRGSSVKKI